MDNTTSLVHIHNGCESDNNALADGKNLREAAHHRPSPSAALEASHPVLSDEDLQLVTAIRVGDASAAAPLYNRLVKSIEKTISRVLRDRPPEFEDLVQITFERIIRTVAAGKFEGRSQLTTWASAIAAHVALDWLRRRTQEHKLFQSSDALPSDAHMSTVLPERQIEARSEVRRIHAILERMNPRGAVLLVMHDVLGHSVPEVAEMLGIQLSAAQSRLRRAREEFVRRHTTCRAPAGSAPAGAYMLLAQLSPAVQTH